MERMKVYLDTSVISFLLAKDSPEKMADTRALWEMFKAKKYEVFLSTVTLREIQNCPEPKRSLLVEHLNQIHFETLDVTERAIEIAEKIVSLEILSAKNFDDCQHIAAAILGGCDCIVSWNFKHIVNVKTIRGVRAIADLEGCKTIEIWNPSVLLETGEQND